jgi:hypothetical protein
LYVSAQVVTFLLNRSVYLYRAVHLYVPAQAMQDARLSCCLRGPSLSCPTSLLICFSYLLLFFLVSSPSTYASTQAMQEVGGRLLPVGPPLMSSMQAVPNLVRHDVCGGTRRLNRGIVCRARQNGCIMGLHHGGCIMEVALWVMPLDCIIVQLHRRQAYTERRIVGLHCGVTALNCIVWQHRRQG